MARIISRFLAIAVWWMALGTAGQAAGQPVLPADALTTWTNVSCQAWPPQWVPHARELIAETPVPGQLDCAIYRISTDTGEQQLLANGSSPQISPDGKNVAFLRSPARNVAPLRSSGFYPDAQLWTIGIDGSGELQRTHVSGGVGQASIAWSHDSRKIIVFYRPSPRADTLATPSQEQGKLQRPAPGLTVEVEKNGYDENQSGDGPIAIRLIDIVLNTESEVSTSRFPGMVRAVFSAGWFQDDRDVLVGLRYFSKGTKGFQTSAYRFSTTSGQVTDLHLPDLPQSTPLLLSPKGDTFAFLTNPGGSSGAWGHNDAAIRERDGSIRYLTHDKNVYCYEWSSAGKYLYCLNSNAFHHVVLKVSEHGVKPVTVIENVFRINGTWTEIDAPVSDNGTEIAYVQWDLYGIPSLHVRNLESNLDRTLMVESSPAKKYQLGKAFVLHWTGSLGRRINGLVVLPPGYRSGQRYPLIVDVHGGPSGGVWFTGSLLGLTPLEFQMWAARGFVVFVPDYCEAMTVCAWNEFLTFRARNTVLDTDTQDILSGVNALAHVVTIAPKGMAVIGHSWGSAVTNWLITHTNRFAAAISFDGWADASVEWGRGAHQEEWMLGGTPLTHRAAYAAASATTYAGKVTTPTLFVVGEDGINDPAMHWMYEALVARHIDTGFLIYHHDNHVLRNPANRRDLLERSIRWIDEHIQR